MKQMKFLIAGLAIAFVVITSAFTTKKSTTLVPFKLMAAPQTVTFNGHTDAKQFLVATLSDQSGGNCDQLSNEFCTVEIENATTVDGTYILDNSQQPNQANAELRIIIVDDGDYKSHYSVSDYSFSDDDGFYVAGE